MKNKILVGTVIVLSVLVLLMGGYIIYDKTNEKVLDNKNEVTDKEGTNKEQDKTNDEKDVKVIDAKVIKEEGLIVKNISIPKLVIDSADALILNKKIETEILNRFSGIEGNNVDEKHYAFSVDYDYLVLDDLVRDRKSVV